MVSTLTEVTSQFLSAAVSRTFCSTDRPEYGGGGGGNKHREFKVGKIGNNNMSNYELHMNLKTINSWLSGW